MNSQPHKRCLAHSAAFTLMEMVTSCLVLSLLMVSLGYGLKLALVSTGNGATQAVASLEASDIVERVTDDLNEAINFTEKTAEAVTFTVPDRGTDGQPDKVRYKWWPTGGTITIPSGGSAGLFDSTNGSGNTTITVPPYTLTRQINDGDTSVLGRDVRTFNLNYLYRTMSPAAVAGNGERLLWQHDPSSGIPTDFGVDTSRFIGETFLPSSRLPAGTTSWSITKVALYLKSDTTAYDGLIRVSVRPISTNVLQANWPTATLLDSAQVAEVSLANSHGWVEVSFTNLNNLGVNTKYAIVVQGLSGSNSGSNPYMGIADYVQTSFPPSNTWLVISTNGGLSWSTTTLHSLRYKIYGTTTP